MSKNNKVLGCVLLICILLLGMFFILKDNNKYPFADEEVRDAKMFDTSTEYMLRHSERKQLTKILQEIQMKKVDSEVQKTILHSSRRFQIETNKAVHEIVLYGKVGDSFVCEINKERCQVEEHTYKELEQLYDRCFRNAHEELFDGFKNAKSLRITLGIGNLGKEFAEEETEVMESLHSLLILEKAEDTPTEVALGTAIMKIETEKDSVSISNSGSYENEPFVCTINGVNYRVDRTSWKQLLQVMNKK